MAAKTTINKEREFLEIEQDDLEVLFEPEIHEGDEYSSSDKETIAVPTSASENTTPHRFTQPEVSRRPVQRNVYEIDSSLDHNNCHGMELVPEDREYVITDKKENVESR